VPENAVPLGTDYASAFRLEAKPGNLGTAEQWARGVFEGPPLVVRLAIRFGWIFLLRLRLAPSNSEDHVAGWTIATDTPTTFRMRVDSPLMAASNRAEVDDAGVLWVTEVDFANRLGRVLWAFAAPIHHLTIPMFLRNAARKINP
jgi:hypothetical protein